MKKIVVLIGLVLACAAILPALARAEAQQILMVVTSADQMSDGTPTGLWLEEFAVPYLKFKEAGFAVTVASTKGGAAPVDPRSLKDAGQVQAWKDAAQALKETVPLSKVGAEKYDAIFLPGGHGTMFDFPGNGHLKELLQQMVTDNRVIGAVCHGPSGLVGATNRNGTPLVAGKTITAFTDEEEKAISLDRKMPFLLEAKLRAEGAKFVVGQKWASHVVVDGKLVTGQNPASSGAAAEAVIRLLRN